MKNATWGKHFHDYSLAAWMWIITRVKWLYTYGSHIQEIVIYRPQTMWKRPILHLKLPILISLYLVLYSLSFSSC